MQMFGDGAARMAGVSPAMTLVGVGAP